MVLDQFTRRNLELTETIRSRKSEGSLLGVLDRTVTAMGARLLRAWISQPLLDLKRLNARLDAVEALTKDETLRAELRDYLRGVSDLERLTNRLLIGKAGPRDLLALKQSLDAVPLISALIQTIPALLALTERLDPCAEISDQIARAINDDPPATLNVTGVIRPGYSDELDNILHATRDAREWIANLEPQERRRTGIATLKVGFNKVFGYYIEVSRAQADNVPDDYIRKQTLVNGERYITPELKEYETLVLNAEEQILDVERRLFEAICREFCASADRLLSTARALAHLDAFLSLADVAAREGYIRPTLTQDDLLILKDGRHPVVERMLDGGVRYVPNDTQFDSMSRIHIITGPNMSGKSTYIRQVAIITLLAQIGSFVPADEATIGLVDRIFARIGAQDEIHAGSKHVHGRDGRDGAAAQRQHPPQPADPGRGGARHLDLRRLGDCPRGGRVHPQQPAPQLPHAVRHPLSRTDRTAERAAARAQLQRRRQPRKARKSSFCTRSLPGGADQQLRGSRRAVGGLPRPVVERARELLHQLEEQSSDFEPAAKKRKKQNPEQLTMFDEAPNPALTALKALEVDHLSPIEALTKLYELKRMARRGSVAPGYTIRPVRARRAVPFFAPSRLCIDSFVLFHSPYHPDINPSPRRSPHRIEGVRGCKLQRRFVKLRRDTSWLFVILILVVVAIVARALPGARTIDDAFITFRYSRNLAEGLGFVYNPGVHTLGTTTPLFALTLAAISKLTGGEDFQHYAIALSALADALTCVLLYLIARRTIASEWIAALPGLLWAISPLSVTFAVGGMETSVNILWIMAATWFYVEHPPKYQIGIGICAALGLLTRIDAVLWIAPLFAWQLVESTVQ